MNRRWGYRRIWVSSRYCLHRLCFYQVSFCITRWLPKMCLYPGTTSVALLVQIRWSCEAIMVLHAGTRYYPGTLHIYGERPLPNMVLYPGTRYYLWDSWPSLVRPASARGSLDQFPLTPLLSPVHALHKWPPALHRTAAYWKHTAGEKSNKYYVGPVPCSHTYLITCSA